MAENLKNSFHAHIYFDSASRGSAEELHRKIQENIGTHIRHLSRLVDRPIGPHPVPMFEVDFAPAEFSAVVGFLMFNHGPHAVLIHPQTGDDLTDHTVHALWLGKQLDLNLDKL